MRFLDLVFLLNGVDPVLALDVSTVRFFGMAVKRVDGISNILPVFLTEIASVEFEITASPGINKGRGGFFTPTIFTDR